jgi:hypothetical protein
MLPQVQARVREYPFLEKYADLSELVSVKVERMDSFLLTKGYEKKPWVDLEFPEYEERYLFLDKNGELLAETGWDLTEVVRTSFRLRRPSTWLRPLVRKSYENEQVHQTLERLGSKILDVRWCLMVLGDDDGVHSLVLYGLPAGHDSVTSWLEDLEHPA